MEKNNEKDLRAYVRPEMINIYFQIENVMAGSQLEPGEDGGEIDD